MAVQSWWLYFFKGMGGHQQDRRERKSLLFCATRSTEDGEKVFQLLPLFLMVIVLLHAKQ